MQKGKTLSGDPAHLWGIEPKSSWYRRISTEKAAEISAKLAAELSFPGDFYVVVFTKKSEEFKEALEQVAYSLIYRRAA